MENLIKYEMEMVANYNKITIAENIGNRQGKEWQK